MIAKTIRKELAKTGIFITTDIEVDERDNHIQIVHHNTNSDRYDSAQWLSMDDAEAIVEWWKANKEAK